MIGAGWIGLETAAAAREHGAAVTVVEMDTLPLRRVLGDEVAAVFRDVHHAHGVTFHFDVGVREFGDAGGRVTHVVLDDGTEVPADLVIVGVGIQPNVELAQAAGLEVDNGVVTDERLRTSDPDIYAAGDVASFLHPLLGQRIRVEHWANARTAGGRPRRRCSAATRRTTGCRTSSPTSTTIGMEYAGYVEPGRLRPGGVPWRPGDRATTARSSWPSGSRGAGAGRHERQHLGRPGRHRGAGQAPGYAGTAVDRRGCADPEVPLASLLEGNKGPLL